MQKVTKYNLVHLTWAWAAQCTHTYVYTLRFLYIYIYLFIYIIIDRAAGPSRVLAGYLQRIASCTNISISRLISRLNGLLLAACKFNIWLSLSIANQLTTLANFLCFVLGQIGEMVVFLFRGINIDSITIVSHIRCWLFSKHKRNRRNLSQLQPCVFVCVCFGLWVLFRCVCGVHHFDCLVLHLKLQQQVTFRGVVYISHLLRVPGMWCAHIQRYALLTLLHTIIHVCVYWGGS